MTKYEKLAIDLTIAVKKAKEAAQITPDGGTCNFDSMLIRLPRWKIEEVKKAAENAGIRAYYLSYCGSKYVSFTNPIDAIADRNTEQAEVMEKYMKQAGYDTAMYYAMD